MAEKRKAQRKDTARKGRTAGRDMTTPLAESKFDSRDLNKDGKVTAAERMQAAAGRALGDEQMFYNPQMDRAGKAIKNQMSQSLGQMRQEAQPYVTQAKKAADYFGRKTGLIKE
jgi:hypothetical protein